MNKPFAIFLFSVVMLCGCESKKPPTPYNEFIDVVLDNPTQENIEVQIDDFLIIVTPLESVVYPIRPGKHKVKTTKASGIVYINNLVNMQEDGLLNISASKYFTKLELFGKDSSKIGKLMPYKKSITIENTSLNGFFDVPPPGTQFIPTGKGHSEKYDGVVLLFHEKFPDYVDENDAGIKTKLCRESEILYYHNKGNQASVDWTDHYLEAYNALTRLYNKHAEKSKTDDVENLTIWNNLKYLITDDHLKTLAIEKKQPNILTVEKTKNALLNNPESKEDFQKFMTAWEEISKSNSGDAKANDYILKHTYYMVNWKWDDDKDKWYCEKIKLWEQGLYKNFEKDGKWLESGSSNITYPK